MSTLTKPTTKGITHLGQLLYDYLQNHKGFDIKAFGAVYDGVTDNAAAIEAAILASGGNIVISGKCFVSRTIYIKGYTNPVVSFEGSGEIVIDKQFSFRAGTRGILCFHECHNPQAREPVITGARVFHPTAPEPWQDGDAGIEYIVCTGWCLTKGGRLDNFMTWGVIHAQYESYCVDGTHISNCMVQSGVGGISGKQAVARNLTMHRIGLYGLEVESRDPLIGSHIQNILITQSHKGVMCYDSIRRPSIQGVTAVDCMEGVSMNNNTGNTGEGGSVEACNLINCRTSLLCKGISKSRWVGNTMRRFDAEVYTRVRAQDFIREVTNGTAWMVNESSATSSLAVGNKIKFEDDVVRTVTSVTTKFDPVFKDMIGFTTTPAVEDEHTHHAMFQPMVPGYAGMVMYDGLANTVQGNAFGYLENALLSYGAHSQLMWTQNTYENVTTVFANGQDGAITDSKLIVKGEDVVGVTDISNHAKFNPALKSCYHLWLGGVAVGHEHIISFGKGKISRIVCVLDPSVTATGDIVLKINGVDTILGFSGTPPAGVADVNISVSGSLRVQLTDTAGDIKGYGFSLKVYGGFTED